MGPGHKASVTGSNVAPPINNPPLAPPPHGEMYKSDPVQRCSKKGCSLVRALHYSLRLSVEGGLSEWCKV